MGFNKKYRNKLDSEGNPIIENGDFVMELVSSVEVPDEIQPPNWLKLEQDLRYSPLFAKAFSEASDKGLSLFMITLLNGKKGDSSENALSFAFSVLGVVWTSEEITQLNEILTANNFTIQL